MHRSHADGVKKVRQCACACGVVRMQATNALDEMQKRTSVSKPTLMKRSATNSLTQRTGRSSSPQPRVDTRCVEDVMAAQDANSVVVFVTVETDCTSILFECQLLDAIFNAQRAHWERVDAHLGGSARSQQAS